MSASPIITQGIGPLGSVLYALTGGFGIGAVVAPAEISSFLVNLRGGGFQIAESAGRMTDALDAGAFTLRVTK